MSSHFLRLCYVVVEIRYRDKESNCSIGKRNHSHYVIISSCVLVGVTIKFMQDNAMEFEQKVVTLVVKLLIHYLIRDLQLQETHFLCLTNFISIRPYFF